MKAKVDVWVGYDALTGRAVKYPLRCRMFIESDLDTCTSRPALWHSGDDGGSSFKRISKPPYR